MKERNIFLSRLFFGLMSLAVFLPVPALGRIPKEPLFRIGLIYPRTGPMAAFGQSLSEGVKLGLQQFRDENPQIGARIGVVVADDGGLASQAEKAAERLINTQKVHIVIGSISNVINQSVATVTSKNEKLLIMPRATDESLVSDPHTFSLSVTDRRQGQMMARFALRQLRRDRAAILVDAYFPDSETIAKGFADSYTQGGGQVLGQWKIGPDKSNLATQMQELAATQPSVVVFPGSYLSVKALMKSAREAGLKAVWLGSDGWDHEALLKNNPDLGTQYFFSYFHLADPQAGVQNFSTDFEAAYGHKPDVLAAYGYEAIRLILQAYTLTHSTETSELLKALEGARLGSIYGAGHFSRDRIYLRPSPFLMTNAGQVRFMSRIELED